MHEFYKRLRIAAALVAGFFCGKFAAAFFGHHAEAFFSAGFMLGVLITQGGFWLTDKLLGKTRARVA